MAHSSNALAVVNDSSLRAKDSELALLQRTAIEQHDRINRNDAENALRCLFLGCALHRIKASLKHGEFGPWITRSFSAGSRRQVNYYMKAALVFIDKAKVQKPELLALPGDQLDLAVDGPDTTARRFTEKAIKFIAGLSFGELLGKHGIKDSKKLGGAREKGESTGEAPAAILSPEQLAQLAQDEWGAAIERMDALLHRDNKLQHLLGRPDFVRGLLDWSERYTAALKKATKPILK